MANFFEKRLDQLDLSLTQMAARLGMTAEGVRRWNIEKSCPTQPIADLAVAYEVSEQIMEREVMALRRRIEAKRAVVVK